MASLVESARRAEDMRRAPELGVGVAEFKLSAKQVAERASRLAESRARATSAEVLTAHGVTIMRGGVSFVDARSLLVGDITIKPRKVLIAIGGVPVMLDIPGLGDIEVFTIDSILENQRKLTHLVIIGADAAAIEQAQLQRRLGAAVTLVPHGDLLADFDPAVVSILLNILADEGISVRPGGRAVAIRKRSQGIGIEMESGGQREVLDASHVMVSFGRTADLNDLNVGKAGFKAGTNSSRSIRMVGAAAGHCDWSAAQAHGRAMVDTLVGKRRASSARIVPRLIETEPAIAQIDRFPPRSSKAQSGDIILRENFSENDRAAAMGSDQGLVKVTLDGKGFIQGLSLIGPQGGELAAVMALAMERKLGIAELAHLPLPHPSLFDVFSRLGENYLGSSGVSAKGPGRAALQRLLGL